MNKGKRLLWLDVLRGLAMINMLLYHALYDLVYLFQVPISWFGIQKSYAWQQAICWCFILVSGISLRLSTRPWKNAIKILAGAVLLSVVTITVMPSEAIYFGILHFLGCAILITWFLLPLFRRIPAGVGGILSFVLFLLTRSVPGRSYDIPYLFWLGFPDNGFTSADYFPLIPWIFLFWAGYFAGHYLLDRTRNEGQAEKERTADKGFGLPGRLLGSIGRNSLLIYMLHQPIIYGLLWIWDNMFKQ